MRYPLLTLVLMASLALAQSKPTLYERLGRYDAISTIAEDYLTGLRADPRFKRFSGGRSADGLRRAKQMLKDQLCALTGGPCTYPGKDMRAAHGGLGISAEEWEANMKYLAAALDQSKITGAEKTEFLAVVESLKPQIVEKSQ
jgi:hemoglobin